MPGARFADIRRFDSIDSTNRYLLDQARAGAPAGVVAVADHQSAGRGRLSRRWEAPPGSNLLMSVLLRPSLAPGQRHLASVVVALAAADAVLATIGAELGIKWPNDLQAPDGRKVAGVLAEADLVGAIGSGPAPVVVGIGINVNWPAGDRDLPPELAGAATSLRQLLDRQVDRAALLDAVLGALAPRVDALESSAGRDGQATDFAGRCTTLGTQVRVEMAGSAFEGVATQLTADGHLIVDDHGVARTVVAGDVIHLRPGGGTGDVPGRRRHAD
jgi:BirA family transcriptional regulator, biotin operon repressor / biotin---[acetyl-CoA-carboxylase] ligase